MSHFRRCNECGAHFPRETESCPSCGRFSPSLRHLAFEHHLPAVGGLPLLTAIAVLLVPGDSAIEAGLFSASFGPLMVALAYLAWRWPKRDPACHALRARALEAELEEIEKDLADSNRRIADANREIEEERHPRVIATLERELDQDRRLREAQRRLVYQLARRLDQLEVDRFRDELRFFQACRDRRVEAPELAEELRARIDAIEARSEEGDAELWEPLIEEARFLRRQLVRGVQRLDAARRLDPLAHVETDTLRDETPDTEAGALEEQTDHQLERIDRGFDAVDELDAHLAMDADSSGVRLRVDDEVLAALDEAEVELELEREDRISVDRI